MLKVMLYAMPNGVFRTGQTVGANRHTPPPPPHTEFG